MHQVHEIIASLARDVATPHARRVLAALESGDLIGLQKIKPELVDYQTGEAGKLRMDLLVSELLRKCDLPTGVDKRAAAVETFWSCERANALTNARLDRYVHDWVSDPADMHVHRFFDDVRKEIRGALPPLPTTLVPLFSNGATVGDGSLLSTKPDKLSNRPQVYSNTVDLLDNSFWDTAWGRLVKRRRTSAPQVVRGNHFFTVPKDGTKDRGCAKEASINIGLQKAAAMELRKGLRSFGIDLSTGKERHMRLAREGSRYGHLATIDLSNASDTLATGLVKAVMPTLWYDLLASLRAPFTRIDGSWVRLEKFSSMGNGFTFELETLIFASLARVCCRWVGVDPEHVTVFGDDIILPVGASPMLARVLSFVGFTINERKTFLEGPFRESCGGDYFEGQSVRAVYLETLPREPHEWIALHNKLWAHSLAGARAARLIKRFVPSHVWSCRGPSHLGDLVFHDRSLSRWSLKEGNPSEPATCVFNTWHPVATVIPWYHWSPDVKHVSALIGESSRGVTPRNAVSGYRHKLVAWPGSTWLPN